MQGTHQSLQAKAFGPREVPTIDLARVRAAAMSAHTRHVLRLAHQSGTAAHFGQDSSCEERDGREKK